VTAAIDAARAGGRKSVLKQVKKPDSMRLVALSTQAVSQERAAPAEGGCPRRKCGRLVSANEPAVLSTHRARKRRLLAEPPEMGIAGGEALPGSRHAGGSGGAGVCGAKGSFRSLLLSSGRRGSRFGIAGGCGFAGVPARRG